jgi:hypothetical protein
MAAAAAEDENRHDLMTHLAIIHTMREHIVMIVFHALMVLAQVGSDGVHVPSAVANSNALRFRVEARLIVLWARAGPPRLSATVAELGFAGAAVALLVNGSEEQEIISTHVM